MVELELELELALEREGGRAGDQVRQAQRAWPARSDGETETETQRGRAKAHPSAS
jgi:hypothetical protein